MAKPAKKTTAKKAPARKTASRKAAGPVEVVKSGKDAEKAAIEEAKDRPDQDFAALRNAGLTF